MQINLQDIDKLSLVKRIQAHELNGYECVCRVSEKKSMCKRFKYDDNQLSKKKRKFAGVDYQSVYVVKMRKVVSL